VAGTYARVHLADAGALAARAEHALDSRDARRYLAQTLTRRVLERSAPELVAARPVVESVLADVVDNSSFHSIVRRAVRQADGLLLTREEPGAALLRSCARSPNAGRLIF
jgi:hypothetical protein